MAGCKQVDHPKSPFGTAALAVGVHIPRAVFGLVLDAEVNHVLALLAHTHYVDLMGCPPLCRQGPALPSQIASEQRPVEIEEGELVPPLTDMCWCGRRRSR